MTPSIRDLPITTCTWQGDRWVISLPGGPREARDDREAVQLVARHAYGAAIRWLLPPIADITSAAAAASLPSAGSGQPEPA